MAPHPNPGRPSPPPRDQRAYWDKAATTKTFTHPLDVPLFARGLAGAERVLDAGCGHGRLLQDRLLQGPDAPRAVGLDSSPGMLVRARADCGAASRGGTAPPQLVSGSAVHLPFAASSFDAALLFSVVTCLPHPEDQELAFAGLLRVLRPGGVLLVSDLEQQDDERNRARYADGAARYGRDDVFTLDEGAGPAERVVLTHPSRARWEQLWSAFEPVAVEPFEVITMNGNRARALRAVLRKPALS